MTSRGAAALAFCFLALAALPAVAAPYPTVSFTETTPVTVNENAGTVTLHLVRTGDLSLESKVAFQPDYQTTTAARSADYELPNYIAFAPQQAAVDLVISIVDDHVYEPTETLTVSMYDSYQAQIGTPSRVPVVISDDDPATLIGFSRESYSVSEGAGVATMSVTRSGVTNVPSSVDYATANGSAQAGLDYTASSGTLTFAPGETVKTFTVPILQETLPEFSEDFTVRLSGVDGGAIVSGVASCVIADDDVPAQVGFSPATYTVGEGDGTVTLTVVRSVNLDVPVAVHFATSPSTDYLSTSGYLVFAPGETQKSLTIAIFDDLVAEPTEGFFVTLAANDATQVTNGALVQILDNDGTASLAFTPATYSTNETGGSVTLTVTRSALLTGTTVATYTTADGTATAGADFTAASGTLTFAPGETTKTIVVPILNDTAAESAESFTVSLTTAGATITDGTALVTITDDDVPDAPATFAIDAAPSQVAENAGSIAVTVRRTGSTTAAATVAYATENGTAVAGADYVATSGTLNFAAGETVKTIAISIVNDSTHEDAESFNLRLSSPSTGVLGRALHAITITDDDPVAVPPTYRFVSTYLPVSESAGHVSITVLREGNVAAASSVAYNTAAGCCGTFGATAGADYIETAGTLTFAAGETSKTIDVPILQDELIESTERFLVRLATSYYSEVVVDITDDDALPQLVANDVVVTEGNAGTKQVAVTVRLTKPVQYAVNIPYGTIDGSATAPSDYVTGNGSIVFAAGETAKTITLTVNGDTADEGDEYFNVLFGNGYYYWNESGLHATAMVTIRNDDASFSVADATVNEGDGGNAQAKFTVRLSVPLASPASIHYTTLAGSAQFDSDFTGVSGTLTFAPGETAKEITVPVIGDRVAEENETFFLRLSDAIGAPITRAQAKATIVNDDEFSIEYDGLEYAGAGKHALALDLFLPTAESAAPRPVVIWVHGDHWSDGSRAASPAIREANRGYAVASIDYRSSDAAAFPAQIDDVKAAVRWLRANAARYNLDPERFAVWGFGSGGHLAALAGTSGGVATLEDLSEGNAAFSSRVQLVIDWAGPIDLLQMQNDSLACSTTNHDSSGSYESLLIGCSVQRCPERAAAASPSSYVTADDPPFLVMHGRADCEVGPAQSESFARLLRAAQLEVALKTYEDVGHTGPFWDTAEALSVVDAFLDAHFKAPPRSRAAPH